MSRISRQKQKYDIGNEVSQDGTNDGTAARTRPFSFEEIMLRRQNSKLNADAKGGTGDPGKVSEKDNGENVPNHSKADKGHGDVMKHASEYTMKGSSTKKQEGATPKEKGHEDIMKHASEDTMKGSSTKKQEGATPKETGHENAMKHASEVTVKGSSTKKQEGATPKEKGHEDVMKHASEDTMKGSSTKKQEGDTPKEGSLVKVKGKEICDAGKVSEKDNGENVPKHSKSDKGCEHVIKHSSEDTMKGSSTKKQEDATPKEDNLVKGKGKEFRDAEPNLKHKLEKDLNSRVKGERNEKRSHHRSRNEERSKDDTAADKKRSENSVGKEKYLDTEIRKSERESKRKHRSRDDENNRYEIEGNAVKKRDSGRWHDLELAEKKSRKKDSSQSHYEEARPKRRRSRSRETRDRDRRSISLSPRAHRRTSHHGREHGESSLNSLKERKQYSDVDRGKLSTNGGYASTHYQRHGGRGSRLGGYSPRKRRTEAAVKTPSPTTRSPERKSAGWDLPPIATGISSAAPSSAHELPSGVTSTTNAARTQAGAPSSTPSMPKSVSVDSIQLTQATRPMRILHVENVPTSASDKSIVDGLNNFFLSSGAYHIQGSPPCISCVINKEKGQALVEFLTPEDATTALSFDGRSFLGFILKVRRLKDFNESSTGTLEKSMAAVDSIPDLIKDSPYKIFIGGISKILSSDMMLEIASAFGTLRAYRFNLSEDMSCAFLEYVDHSVTLKACAGLNGMKLGGQILTAVQATPDALMEDNAEVPPFYGIPEHAKPLLSKPTTILKLKNVLNKEELSTLPGPELEEVLEDTRLECARFGTVKSINIVKYDSTSAHVPEAFEVTDQADVRTASQNAADENYTKNSKSMAGSDKSSRQEAEQDVGEPLVDDGNAEDNKPSHHDEHEEDLMKPCETTSSVAPDVSTCHMDTDTDLQESFNHHDTTKDQSTHHDDTNADFIPRSDSSEGNNLTVEEDLKPEETSCELQESLIENNGIVKKDSDASDKNKNQQQGSNLDDVFEHGCIFVEYARTEASSAAAYCLHGRLYGDRVVEVGYVDHDLYISRFRK